LARYRREQALIALERDDYECQYCLRRLGEHVPGSKPHHVYGRGSWDSRLQYEAADKLLTLCYYHHQRCHHVAPLLKEEMKDVLEEVLDEQEV
jgi:hypothetical protein